jgi:hypothetical protein
MRLENDFVSKNRRKQLHQITRYSRHSDVWDTAIVASNHKILSTLWCLGHSHCCIKSQDTTHTLMFGTQPLLHQITRYYRHSDVWDTATVASNHKLLPTLWYLGHSHCCGAANRNPDLQYKTQVTHRLVNLLYRLSTGCFFAYLTDNSRLIAPVRFITLPKGYYHCDRLSGSRHWLLNLPVTRRKADGSLGRRW